jgi:SAM-dependent methyltransferase
MKVTYGWRVPDRHPKAKSSASMASLQEVDYGADRDYTHGSPHLVHVQLRTRIEDDLSRLVRMTRAERGTCHALEVGAGHGTFTGTLLAAGATVTVTEMSEPSVAVLKQRFAGADVEVIYDSEGVQAAQVAARGCDLVIFISVLHHIPNYLTTVGELVNGLRSGGAFYCAQDPMWYPSRSRFNMAADRGAYMLWRLGQGNVKRGLKTRVRRLRGVYDETEAADMVEYHVVRQGVDERALATLLRERFDVVETWLYWSTQAKWLQRLGERLGWKSTFGMIAVRKLPDPAPER